MSSLFSWVFACCVRSNNNTKTLPDETTYLIPDDNPNIPDVVVVDHQKLKDRLGTIVRSKEGKMVNVNSQIPFNLYNQPPRPSSRSVSGSHLNYSSSRQPSPSPSPHPSSTSTDSLDDEAHPVLNVRLARGMAPGARGRGRARGRAGRVGDGDGEDGGEHEHKREEAEPTSPDADADLDELKTPTAVRGFAVRDAGAISRSWSD